MADQELTLIEHLDELRNRLIKSVIAIIVCFIVFLNFVDIILPFLIEPVGKLVFIAPQEGFVSRIKIAFFAGLFLSSPILLYQAWCFVSTALKINERKYLLFYGPLSFVFFSLGAVFGYIIIVPIGMKFLLSFATDQIMPMISITKYISFVGTLTLAFGVVFELPLVSLFLTKIGVVTPLFLSQKRKHAIVIIFILAALFTPPDIVTQCLMALPLLGLYEIGILFSKMVYKKK